MEGKETRGKIKLGNINQSSDIGENQKTEKRSKFMGTWEGIISTLVVLSLKLQIKTCILRES